MHWTHKVIIVYNDGRTETRVFLGANKASQFYERIKAIAFIMDIMEISPVLRFEERWEPHYAAIVGSKVVKFVNDGQHQSAIVIQSGEKRYCLTISNDRQFIISED